MDEPNCLLVCFLRFHELGTCANQSPYAGCTCTDSLAELHSSVKVYSNRRGLHGSKVGRCSSLAGDGHRCVFTTVLRRIVVCSLRSLASAEFLGASFVTHHASQIIQHHPSRSSCTVRVWNLGIPWPFGTPGLPRSPGLRRCREPSDRQDLVFHRGEV